MITPDLYIDHLRIHDTGGKRVALKLGLEQALRQVRFQQGRLPPSAILIIRSLKSRQVFGLKATEMHQWQRQVQAQIEELARRAFRPGKQYVPPEAQSVLFYDEAALLVCYTRDVLARRMTWYWTDLFPAAAYPGQPTGQQLLVGWGRYPQAIPHLLVALKPHEMRSALNSLNRPQLSRLAHLLHETFDLLGDALEAAVPDTILVQQESPTKETHPEPLDRQLQVLSIAPWREWLPPQFSRQLTPQAEYILGLCLTLVRRPEAARQQQFAQVAKDWLEQSAFRSQSGPGDQPMTTTEQVNVSQRAESNQPDGQTAESSTESLLQEGIESSLGGAIYLINLLTRLKLPTIVPCLEELNPWERLGAVTASLLGDRFHLYEIDPFWGIINELARLEGGERWGEGLSQPDRFYLPPEWLGYFSNETIACRLERRNGRSRLWDEETGLLLADLPDEDGRLDKLTTQYWEAGFFLHITPGAGWTNLPNNDNGFMTPTLAWYMVRLRPSVAHILDYLTGEPIESILHQPATFYISRTHVDLCLSLEQISLPLRRAGLDQTPGWLPDYGYIVTIYFE